MNEPKTDLFEDLDRLPVGVLCASETGKILFCNRFARALFPKLRRGAALCRFLEVSPEDKRGVFCRLCDVPCLVVCRALRADASLGRLLFYFIWRVSPELSGAVPEVLDLRPAALGERICLPQAENERLCRRHLLRLIREKERLIAVADLLFAPLSSIRDLHPGRAFAFNAVEFLATVSASLDRFRALTEIRLRFACQAGVTLFCNYHDLFAALLCALLYPVTFLCATELEITLTERGSRAYLRIRALDPCGVSDLYTPLGSELDRLPGQRAFLFPLVCAEQLCKRYGAGVFLPPPDQRGGRKALVLDLRVPTTLELPHLTVRVPDLALAGGADFRILPAPRRRKKTAVSQTSLF